MNIELTNEEIDMLYRLDYSAYGFSRIESRSITSSLPVERGIWHLPDLHVEGIRVIVATLEDGGVLFNKMESQTVRGTLKLSIKDGELL